MTGAAGFTDWHLHLRVTGPAEFLMKIIARTYLLFKHKIEITSPLLIHMALGAIQIDFM